MCHVYQASVLKDCKNYPLNSLIERMSEMKEMFDIIEEVIDESLAGK